jgi:hypothetical protein
MIDQRESPSPHNSISHAVAYNAGLEDRLHSSSQFSSQLLFPEKYPSMTSSIRYPLTLHPPRIIMQVLKESQEFFNRRAGSVLLVKTISSAVAMEWNESFNLPTSQIKTSEAEFEAVDV